MSMKNHCDAMGNRTRDFPACSAVPQPTAPPPTLDIDRKLYILRIKFKKKTPPFQTISLL